MSDLEPGYLGMGNIIFKCDTFKIPKNLNPKNLNGASSSKSSDLESVVVHEPKIKCKIYSKYQKISSIHAELEIAAQKGYTHIVNMSGDIRKILYYSKCYNLIILDERLHKFIADSKFSPPSF